ncbi:hypothetical protein FLJC2902T_22550 [Flavobacterium limnosediminis JC2902]|uniref:GYF domain-containing protein n=1 Tax=Flavobacterium limnosediminis JC2902 TaxID=1341181 RepID=V6SLD7_9FLAO|nr:DUF4339 domain-containing protein [Flavobacterium limnosediminis]ESU27077.1 hypothetical protein FLJC2902T_22550 [Flavobacterium limnosediminis JC2902]
MQKYYLHNGTENAGPFDLDELKAKGIIKSTQVWCEGMEDWKEAGTVDELKNILTVVPPPITKKAEPKPVAPIVKKKTNWRWFILKVLVTTVLVLVVFAALGEYSNSQNGPSTYEEQVMTVAEMEANDPLTYLETDGQYRENFLGDRLKIKGFIKNKATVTTYKDVTVEVVFYSKTGSEINTEQYTIYEFYPPSAQKEFELKVTNYGNVAKIGWRIAGALTK